MRLEVGRLSFMSVISLVSVAVMGSRFLDRFISLSLENMSL